jgi:oligopeptide transport system permease protein
VKSSLWRDAIGRLRGDRLAMTSLCVLVGLVIAALVGPLFIGYREDEIDWSHMAAPPFEAGGHWLGTDRLGRDLLLRTLLGLRVSLAIAVAATLVSLVIGVAWGARGLPAGPHGRPDDAFRRRALCPAAGVLRDHLTVVFGRGPLVLLVAIGPSDG